jgi:hypothetical protein
MSGNHDDLVANAFLHVPNVRARETLRCMLRIVLQNQAISSPLISGRVFTPTKGSGMGAIHSGEVSDMLFYRLVEEVFLLIPSVRSQFLIRGYFRYRDDILLIVGRDCDTFKLFKEARRRLSGNYELEVERISPVGVPMLDVFLFVQDGCVQYRPFFKPTLNKFPLLQHSAHAPSVHLSWPAAELRRIARNSSTNAIFLDAKRTFLSYLLDGGIHEDLISQLRSTNQYLLCKSSLMSADAQLASITRIVVPYHPALRGAGLLSAIKCVHAKWCDVLAANAPNLKMAFALTWSKAGGNVGTKLSNLR